MLTSISFLSTTAVALAALSLAAACASTDSEDEGPASAGSATGGVLASGGTTGPGGNAPEGGDAGESAGGSGATSAASGTGGGTTEAASVNLGMAESFVILAKSGISTVPPSAITGDLGVSPAAATYLTGFSLSADPAGLFSTSAQVTGQVFAADYAAPTPSELTTAVSDMELAFTDAAGRPPTATELGAGSIGGMTITPGVYRWSTGLLISEDVTLDGPPTSVWIFQVAEDVTVSNAVSVRLTGGAVSKNVFWQVSGSVAVGTTAHVEGNVLTQTSVTLDTGASVDGRLLAQTAVSMDASTVVQPAL